ncbi:MAG: hypothetical protein J6N70_14200, partial [Oribacterium sp.]|nr:hypothetical protein [Oribacterium sp.]
MWTITHIPTIYYDCLQAAGLFCAYPKLAKYYQDNKQLILDQTGYNERIIGKDDAEFYALARVGEYSYAKNYVVFRDNTKWA